MNIDVELNRVNTTAARASVLAPVFALALFTSAALLFWVQPLVAKMLSIYPRFSIFRYVDSEPYRNPDDIAHIREGLAKAGLRP